MAEPAPSQGQGRDRDRGRRGGSAPHCPGGLDQHPGERPDSTTLTLDGQPLKLDGAGRATLPAHDLKTLHVLTAEVHFSPDRTVRKDVAYGGEYGSEISTELTAVPVRVLSGVLPPPQKLGGWLDAGGQALAVAAVEEGGAQLFVVRVPSARDSARQIASKGTQPGDIQFEMRLEKDDRVRFLQPRPNRVEGSDQLADLFGLSAELSPKRGGLPWLLEKLEGGRLSSSGEAPGAGEERIADAVAVAGLEAMTENRRRAVLLVLAGDERKDPSRYDAATVRRFLAAIHVPLFVWTLGPPAPGTLAASWGRSVAIDQVKNLYAAFGDLQKELRTQRIVLVEGRHLPQSIALGPAARGVELVGAGER